MIKHKKLRGKNKNKIESEIKKIIKQNSSNNTNMINLKNTNKTIQTLTPK